MEERPDLSLCHESHNYNETVVERLTAMGYEVVSLDYYAKAYPEQPEAPRKDDYETDEEYEHAQSEYEQDLNGYMEKCKEIRTRSEAGEITLYFRIGNNDIVLCYIKNSTLAAVGADGTPQVQTLSPVEKLEKQDKRNKEIALEKTVEDTKKQILEVDMVRPQVRTGRRQDDILLSAPIPPQGTFRSGKYQRRKTRLPPPHGRRKDEHHR